MPNIRHDRERCEFYANRVLCAMRHLASIVVYLQHGNGHPPDQIRQLQTLRDNLKAIYNLLFELPVMNGYAYRPPTAQPSGRGRPRYLLSTEQLAVSEVSLTVGLRLQLTWGFQSRPFLIEEGNLVFH